jgi:hypothetical protein
VKFRGVRRSFIPWEDSEGRAKEVIFLCFSISTFCQLWCTGVGPIVFIFIGTYSPISGFHIPTSLKYYWLDSTNSI